MFTDKEPPTLAELPPVFLMKARAEYEAVRTKQPGPAQDRRYARQFRRALAGAGYDAVNAAWNARIPVMSWSDPFRGIEHKGRSPTMEFVRAWLEDERTRRRELRWTMFWGTTVATAASALLVIIMWP
jgi:hypothetical protein